MTKEKRMTKQVRVYTDSAYVIAVLASAFEKTRGEKVDYADVVDEALKLAFPEAYDKAMSTAEDVEQRRSRKG